MELSSYSCVLCNEEIEESVLPSYKLEGGAPLAVAIDKVGPLSNHRTS